MRGHIRKRGPAWQVIVDAGRDPLTGTRRQISRNLRGSKKEAEEVLARLLVEAGGGKHSGTSNASVAELVDASFELAKPDLSPSTVQTTRWFIDLYVRKRIGRLPLPKLTVATLDRYYADLRDSGGSDGNALSASTVRRVHNIVRRALEQGVRWGWIGSNPAAHASPPKLQRAEVNCAACAGRRYRSTPARC
jgi:integrase